MGMCIMGTHACIIMYGDKVMISHSKYSAYTVQVQVLLLVQVHKHVS